MDNFANKVLEWGKANFRPFPWRFDRTPYKVFVAEFLLQKTDSEKVNYIFERILRKYPDLKALSEAGELELREYTGGLGLRYRSRRMIDAAKAFMTGFGGIVPCDRQALLSARGIGNYMTNAILCFGFGAPAAIIDTNTARILMRYWDIQQRVSRCRDDRLLWTFAEGLVPGDFAADYNYALLDLGALVCHAQKANCSQCPLDIECMDRLIHLR
jgi:A/G-specific adenine glycosylase